MILVALIIYCQIPRIWLPIHKEVFYSFAVKWEDYDLEVAKNIYNKIYLYKDVEERINKLRYY